MLGALALKVFGGGTVRRTTAEELESLIATAREERAALSEMLTQVALRSQRLTPIRTALEQVERKATGTGERVEELARQVASLDERAKQTETLGARVQELHDTVGAAHQTVVALTGPGGDIDTHREVVRQLASQAVHAETSLETLKREFAVLEGFREKLIQTQGEVQQSCDQAGSLKATLEQVRALASQTAHEQSRVLKIARESQEQSGAALQGVTEVEQKLGLLATLQELARSTEERIAELNALAELVSHKTKALEGQKQAIDRATSETNRLTVMVGAMEVQIQKLNEGHKHIKRTELLVKRIEELTQETVSQLGVATAAKDELSQALARMDRDAKQLASHVDEASKQASAEVATLNGGRRELIGLRKEMVDFQKQYADVAQLRDRLTADRTAIEAFGERVAALAASAPELDVKMDAILDKFTLIEEGTRQASRVSDVAGEIEARVERLNARLEVVDRVEARIDLLANLNADVDRRLADLLARSSEMESLKLQCESAAALATDAQTRLELVSALDARLAPISTGLEGLQREMANASAQLGRLQRDDEAVGEQERRLAALVVSSEQLSADVTTQVVEVRDLAGQLDRSIAVKEQLQAALARVEERHHEAAARIAASEDQLARAETLMVQLEQRRAQIAFAERKIAAFEGRIGELKQLTDEVNRQIETVGALHGQHDAPAAAAAAAGETADRADQGTDRLCAQHVTEHRSRATRRDNSGRVRAGKS